jgi:hypothetical protein
MTSRFSSIPNARVVAGGAPSTVRRSIVTAGGPNIVGGQHVIGAPIVSNIGGPVVSSIGGPVISNIGGPVVSTIGATRPVVSTINTNAPIISTIGGPSVIGGGIRPSTIVSGGLAPPVQGGLRGSYVINKDQIPAGANVLRV